MSYKIDGTVYEMIPPPRHIAQALGEEIGLKFGLVEEKYKERTLMDKIKGRRPQIERVVTEKAFSNLQPRAKISVHDKPIDLILMRGEYSEENMHHIKIDYDVENKE